MINPTDIADKKFEKSPFGYKTDEVDLFLKELSAAFINIYKENEDSEAKILKLVDKINEYRQDEDAIKNALLGAQKQGNKIIAEAQIEAEKIITEASIKAEQIIHITKEQYGFEKSKLDKMKDEVTNFKSQLTDLYNRQLRLIMEIPDVEQDQEENDNDNDDDNNFENEQNYDTSDNDIKKETVNVSSGSDNKMSNSQRYTDIKFGQNTNR